MYMTSSVSEEVFKYFHNIYCCRDVNVQTGHAHFMMGTEIKVVIYDSVDS
jgi:hypothetical protein